MRRAAEAGALADPAEAGRRRALLAGAAGRTGPMAALVRHAAALRTTHGEVPDADPLDGGAAARLLLLLETPGPSIGGNGIVSADNPTGTGRNLRRFWAEAGLCRRDRVIWNAVPWVIHEGGRNRAPRAAEVRAGLATLPPLLAGLPRLRVAVLAGRAAAGAAGLFGPGVRVLLMPHPSPTIVCTSPEIGRRIGAALGEAAAVLRDDRG